MKMNGGNSVKNCGNTKKQLPAGWRGAINKSLMRISGVVFLVLVKLVNFFTAIGGSQN